MKIWPITPLLLALALLAAACTSATSVSGGSGEADSTDAEQAEPTSIPDESDSADEAEPADAEAETAETEPAETETEELEAADPEPAEEPEADEPDAEEPEPAEAEPVSGSGVAGSGCGSGVAAGTTTQTLMFEGRERTFERWVPAGYDDATPLPVVLNWHGLGSNGAEQLAFSNYGSLADEENFIVVAPTGVPTPGDDRPSWEVSADQDPGRDDVAFANEVLDIVIGSLCVDESRVYTTGISNGGYFSSLLICELSDRIAAASSIAGLTHNDDCSPERFVPYIAFHGVEDEVVPYFGGGESSLAPGQTIDLFLLEILDEFTEFAVDGGCDREPLVTSESDNVVSFAFRDCGGDESVLTLYEIANGGHTWPGSPLSLAISEAIGLGRTTDEINATQVSWDFFQEHTLDG